MKRDLFGQLMKKKALSLNGTVVTATTMLKNVKQKKLIVKNVAQKIICF